MLWCLHVVLLVLKICATCHKFEIKASSVIVSYTVAQYQSLVCDTKAPTAELNSCADINLLTYLLTYLSAVICGVQADPNLALQAAFIRVLTFYLLKAVEIYVI